MGKACCLLVITFDHRAGEMPVITDCDVNHSHSFIELWYYQVQRFFRIQNLREKHSVFI